jgi:hypothetical protein
MSFAYSALAGMARQTRRSLPKKLFPVPNEIARIAASSSAMGLKIDQLTEKQGLSGRLSRLNRCILMSHRLFTSESVTEGIPTSSATRSPIRPGRHPPPRSLRALCLRNRSRPPHDLRHGEISTSCYVTSPRRAENRPARRLHRPLTALTARAALMTSIDNRARHRAGRGQLTGGQERRR